MLTEEEKSAFLESIEMVRRLAASRLSQAGDVGRAIEFVANLHRGLDQVAAQAFELGPIAECRAGCSCCCQVLVRVTDPEVFRIARKIRQQPPSEVDALMERLRRRVSEKEDLGDHTTGQGCVFLVESRCAIYDVRPATCRKAHSLSAKQCEARSPEIPQNLKLLVDAEALMAGTSAAYGDVGLAASAHELNEAVLVALEDDTVESRWYSGENVF